MLLSITHKMCNTKNGQFSKGRIIKIFVNLNSFYQQKELDFYINFDNALVIREKRPTKNMIVSIILGVSFPNLSNILYSIYNKIPWTFSNERTLIHRKLSLKYDRLCCIANQIFKKSPLSSVTFRFFYV